MRKLFFISSSILFILVVLRVVLSFILGPQITDGQSVDFTTSILSQPQLPNNLTTFSVSYTNIWGSKTIHINTTNSDLSYGQEVHIIGNVKEKVLNSSQPVYSIYFPKIGTVSRVVPRT